MDGFALYEIDKLLKAVNSLSMDYRFRSVFFELGQNIARCIRIIELTASGISNGAKIDIKIDNAESFAIKADGELIELCQSFLNRHYHDVSNDTAFFDSNYSFLSNCFSNLNEYINRNPGFDVNMISCAIKNNYIKLSGYAIDMERLCVELGEEPVAGFDLSEKFPMLPCFLFHAVDTILRKDKSVTFKMDSAKSKLHEIYHEAVEMLFNKWELPDVEIFNILSGMTYENSKCNARIVFEKESAEQTDTQRIFFSENFAISISECRKIRKILQMAQTGMTLVANKKYWWSIYGITSSGQFENDIEIHFKGQMKWSLLRAGQAIVDYENGRYSMPAFSDGEKSFKVKLERYFDEPEANEKKLLKVILYARKQDHGTLLIFTNAAEKLAGRLCDCGRGIKIEPFDLSAKIDWIYSITSIDGALIVDHRGYCHAVGVILDGIACKDSNIARGARYNSAYTFIANQVSFDKENNPWKHENEKYMAVVISEDATIDIITNNDIMTPWAKYIQYETEYLNFNVDKRESKLPNPTRAAVRENSLGMDYNDLYDIR